MAKTAYVRMERRKEKPTINSQRYSSYITVCPKAKNPSAFDCEFRCSGEVETGSLRHNEHDDISGSECSKGSLSGFGDLPSPRATEEFNNTSFLMMLDLRTKGYVMLSRNHVRFWKELGILLLWGVGVVRRRHRAVRKFYAESRAYDPGMNIALLFAALFMFRSVVEYFWWLRILFLVVCRDTELCGRSVSRFSAIGGRGNELVHIVTRFSGHNQKL